MIESRTEFSHEVRRRITHLRVDVKIPDEDLRTLYSRREYPRLNLFHVHDNPEIQNPYFLSLFFHDLAEHQAMESVDTVDYKREFEALQKRIDDYCSSLKEELNLNLSSTGLDGIRDILTVLRAMKSRVEQA